MKIRAKIQAPSKANRLRRVEKAEIKARPNKLVFMPWSERMLHYRINSNYDVQTTVDYPLND